MNAEDGATHSRKDGVVHSAQVITLFLRSAQLVLRSSVLTVLDLDEVNVTLKNAEIFGLVLPGGSGSVGGVWRCCRSALGVPQFPPATSKNPTLLIASLFLFCFHGVGATSTAARRLEVNQILSEKRGGKSHFGIILVSAVLGI